MQDLFKRIEPIEKLDKDFVLLDESKLFKPAKNMIEKSALLFEDKDGNFIQQFQTSGFDARIWEIFLFNLFNDNGFEILDEYDRPDFHLLKNGTEIFVEASTSNEKSDDIYTEEFIKEAMALKDIEIQNELIDYYVIRMGSVLYSKVNKDTKYWELDWVKEKPLILAISPFHNYIADFLPDSKIIEYLYGISYVTELNENGLELIEIKEVKNHAHKGKDIPSNFFNQYNVENISAVIFTNNCNLQKFNRMGLQDGMTEDEIIIVRSGLVRSGLAYDPSPHSSGKEFNQIVKRGEKFEDWKESVSIFHNPNALHKIDKEIFKGFRQLWLDENGKFDGEMPEFFVYNSLTVSAINGNCLAGI